MNSRRSNGTSVALPPAGADPVVDLLETADGARRQHDMRALAGKAYGDCGADAARGPGNERDPAGEPAARRGHFRTSAQRACAQAFSVNSESCTETLPLSASAGRIG